MTPFLREAAKLQAAFNRPFPITDGLDAVGDAVRRKQPNECWALRSILKT